MNRADDVRTRIAELEGIVCAAHDEEVDGDTSISTALCELADLRDELNQLELKTEEFPRYKCHKEVRALKIRSIEYKPNPDTTGMTGASSYGAIFYPEGEYDPFDVSAEYMDRHDPHAGGYYVLYKDGYTSFSPADVFESGYTLLEE